MDTAVQTALDKGGVVDITTRGRKSGQPRRIEIYFHNLDGELYITGRPGSRRDWLANLAADPSFTLHLKRDVTADLAARAEVIDDPEHRAKLMLKARIESWRADPAQAKAELDEWVARSPLVRFEVN